MDWRMQWVASTLHTTSEHGVSSITTADAHTSAASSRLNWRPTADLNGLANAVGSQYPSHYLRTRCIQHYYRCCAHLGCQQSTELTPTGRFKWTRPFRRKTKSDFCACAITFQAQSTQVFDWFRRIKYGRISVESDPRSGRPSTSRKKEMIVKVRTVVRNNRRLTVRKVTDDCGISMGSCDNEV